MSHLELCAYDGCDSNTVIAKGLCGKHYRIFRSGVFSVKSMTRCEFEEYSSEKPQHIYIMECDGAYKVGISTSPLRRESKLRCIGFAGIRLAHVFLLTGNDNSLKIEKVAHEYLRRRKLAGEWFACSKTEAVTSIAFAIAVVRADEKISSVILSKRYGLTRGAIPHADLRAKWKARVYESNKL